MACVAKAHTGTPKGNFLSERLASSAAEGRVRYLQQRLRLYRSTASYARPQASGNCTSTEVAHTRPEAGMCDCGTRWSARVAGPCTKGARMPPVREHDASLTRQQQAPHRKSKIDSEVEANSAQQTRREVVLSTRGSPAPVHAETTSSLYTVLPLR